MRGGDREELHTSKGRKGTCGQREQLVVTEDRYRTTKRGHTQGGERASILRGRVRSERVESTPIAGEDTEDLHTSKGY